MEPSPPPALPPTQRLYLDDNRCFAAEAQIVALHGDSVACDRRCFYPGGGGQPAACGSLRLPDGRSLEIASVHADDGGVLWHHLAAQLPLEASGELVRLELDRERRLALTRHHTALHVLNTIALRDYGAWITGAQIGVEHSRIDFKIEGFGTALCAELEAKVNCVLEENRALRVYSIAEDEFRRCGDLLRTLEARPPVIDGRVRVVEIDGFDAQACGGTHARSTAEVGRLSIYRTENKGRINKRLYVRLALPAA